VADVVIYRIQPVRAVLQIVYILKYPHPARELNEALRPVFYLALIIIIFNPQRRLRRFQVRPASAEFICLDLTIDIESV
jgi:hypothetical protein